MDNKFFVFNRYNAGMMQHGSKIAIIATTLDDAIKKAKREEIPILDEINALRPPCHLAHHYSGYFCDGSFIEISENGIIKLPVNF